MHCDGGSVFLFGPHEVVIRPGILNRTEPEGKTSSQPAVALSYGERILFIPPDDFEQFVAALNTANAVCRRYESEGIPKDHDRLIKMFEEDVTRHARDFDDDEDDELPVE